MPYIKIETNTTLDRIQARDFIKKASAYIAAILDKPEHWIMLTFHDRVFLLFNGNDKPAAYIEMKSIGLMEGSCAGLSEKICDFITGELGIPPERIYIEFWDINGKMFGWNRTTF